MQVRATFHNLIFSFGGVTLMPIPYWKCHQKADGSWWIDLPEIQT
jgi:hypothetical protein